MSHILNEVRSTYLDRTRELSQCAQGSFYYYTSSGNRIDVSIGENSATAILNGNSKIVFNFEDLEKPIEEVKVLSLDKNGIRLLQNLRSVSPIDDEKFVKDRVNRIFSHVQYISGQFKAGWMKKDLKKKRIDVGSGVLPEWHECISLEDVFPGWFIDPEYESIIKTDSSNKYGFKLITRKDFESLPKSVDLAFISEQLNLIARESKSDKTLVP